MLAIAEKLETSLCTDLAVAVVGSLGLQGKNHLRFFPCPNKERREKKEKGGTPKRWGESLWGVSDDDVSHQQLVGRTQEGTVPILVDNNYYLPGQAHLYTSVQYKYCGMYCKLTNQKFS